MITLRAALPADLSFLSGHPHSPDEEILSRQIRDGRLQIIESDERPIGLIKSYALWETLPFMEVILLEPEQRGRRHGTQAVRMWEEGLRRRGFDLALISTREDETAQHFWRKLGYADCGMLTVRNKPAEIFMQRALI